MQPAPHKATVSSATSSGITAVGLTIPRRTAVCGRIKAACSEISRTGVGHAWRSIRRSSSNSMGAKLETADTSEMVVPACPLTNSSFCSLIDAGSDAIFGSNHGVEAEIMVDGSSRPDQNCESNIVQAATLEGWGVAATQNRARF